LASKLASRIGLVRVMLYTHLPSNTLLGAIPSTPNAVTAVALLALRQSLCQMDVAARQALVVSLAAGDAGRGEGSGR
jgi:hypothetical protein